MKHVKKSVLLWYSAREIYELVTAIADYPKFLPWCDRAEVLESHVDGVTARLHLNYHGVRHAFTTRNVHVPGESVLMTLVDGPFSRLEGSWRFVALGTPASADDAAGAVPLACRIEFDLSYAFSSVTLEAVVSPVFDRIAHTFVDAFVKRAEQVYGAR
jgi:ribosome-associated toxin RatA of RatAB toxin-antitoxin module